MIEVPDMGFVDYSVGFVPFLLYLLCTYVLLISCGTNYNWR